MAASGSVSQTGLRNYLESTYNNTPGIGSIISQCMNNFPPDYYVGGNGIYGAQSEAEVSNCVFMKVIQNTTGAVANAVDKLVNNTEKAAADAAKSLSELIASASAQQQEAITASTDAVEETVSAFTGDINQIAQSAIVQLQSAVQFHSDNIFDITNSVLSSVGGLVDRAQADMIGARTDLVGVVSQSQQRMEETIKDFLDHNENTAAAVREVLAYLKSKDSGEGTGVIGKVLASLLPDAMAWVTGLREDHSHDVNENLDAISSVLQSGKATIPLLDGLLTGSLPENRITRWVFASLLAPLIIKEFAMIAQEPSIESFRHEIWEDLPSKLFDPATLLTAAIKNPALNEQVRESIYKSGYGDEQQILLRAASRQTPTIDLVTAAFFRNLITDEEWTSNLERMSYAPEHVEMLKGLRDMIPPVQDLIEMAVKEGFSDDIATRFGQDEDFPSDFAKWAKQKGLSEFWTKIYWRTHWKLPSPNMAFEMFQRDIITQEELINLLRALDIMPFYRERLIKLSYRQLDRVDIRRMHALNLISRDDLVTAYRHDGYSPEDAERLAIFTEVYNETSSRLGQYRDLTEAQVRRFYTEGLLEEDEAIKNLMELRYSREDADLIIRSINIEEAAKDRREAIASIVARASKHAITQVEAMAELGALNLSQRELAKATTQITRSKASQSEVPTVQKLDDMYKAKIIDRETYKQGLAAHGYNQTWIDRMASLLEGKGNVK